MDAATQRAMAGFGAATPDGPAGLAVRGYLAEQSRAFLTHSALPVQQPAAVRLRAACLRVGTALAACRELVDAVWADELGRELAGTARGARPPSGTPTRCGRGCWPRWTGGSPRGATPTAARRAPAPC